MPGYWVFMTGGMNPRSKRDFFPLNLEPSGHGEKDGTSGHMFFSGSPSRASGGSVLGPGRLKRRMMKPE
jgi:hypothetical protein